MWHTNLQFPAKASRSSDLQSADHRQVVFTASLAMLSGALKLVADSLFLIRDSTHFVAGSGECIVPWPRTY